LTAQRLLSGANTDDKRPIRRPGLTAAIDTIGRTDDSFGELIPISHAMG
jgi:hypothetical protein